MEVRNAYDIKTDTHVCTHTHTHAQNRDSLIGVQLYILLPTDVTIRLQHLPESPKMAIMMFNKHGSRNDCPAAGNPVG